MSEAQSDTIELLNKRSRRLAAILRIHRKKQPVPAPIMDDFVRAVAASVRQYQRERAADTN